MELLNKTTETRTIETETYSIDGVDPEHAIFEVNVVTTGSEKLSSGRIVKTLKEKEYEWYRPVLVTQDFFERIKTEDPFQLNTVFEDTSCTPNTPDDFSERGLVWVGSSNHTLLDKDLSPLPFCQNYDYCSTFFSDRYINLNDEFLNWLRNHPWVVNKDNIKVMPIPYYNCEEDRTSYVQVSICPDAKSYSEMVSLAKEKSGRLTNVRNMVTGFSGNSKNTPDWFGIRPWLRPDAPV